MVSKNLKNIVELPINHLDSKRIIRLSLGKKRYFQRISWEEVDSIYSEKGSLFVTGDAAFKILQFVEQDMNKKECSKFISNPNCHGAGMYITGIVDYIKQISPKEFKSIYNVVPTEFSYNMPHKGPVLVHLLNEKLEERIEIDDFSKSNTTHSVVFLGRIKDQEVCFEKRGKEESFFSTIKIAESAYGSKLRLFVKNNYFYTHTIDK